MKSFNLNKVKVKKAKRKAEDNKRLPLEKALTGGYVQELPKELLGQANAELEKDEYIQYPNGIIEKVVGNTHEKGGVKLNLPDGSRILSDNLKLGGKNAKELNKEYDLKLKAKDTYAEGMDKYTNKVGLNKLNKNQEGYFKKAIKEEDTQDETTKNTNLNFLSKKIRGIEKDKQELSPERNEFFNDEFELQEKSKGKKVTKTFRYGGTIGEDKFKELAEKFGLSTDEAIIALENGGTMLPKYDKGGDINKTKGLLDEGIIDQKAYEIMIASLNSGNSLRESYTALVSQVPYYERVTLDDSFYDEDLNTSSTNTSINTNYYSDFWDKYTELTGKSVSEAGDMGKAQKEVQAILDKAKTGNTTPKANTTPTDVRSGVSAPYSIEEAFGPKGRERLNVLLDQWGLPNIDDNASKEEMLKSVSLMQGTIAEKAPELLVDYMTGKSHNPNNKTQRILREANYKPTNSGLKKALKDGKLTASDIQEGYKDNLWWYRGLEKERQKVTPEELERINKDNTGKFIKTAESSYLPDADNPGNYIEYYAEDNIVQNKKVEPVITPQPDPTANIQSSVQDTRRRGPVGLITPSRFLPPPSPLQLPQLLKNRRQRIDPVRVGIEDNLTELFKQQNFVSQQLDEIPDSQRASAASNLLAATQENANKAITATNRINAQNQQSAELFNIGQSDKEDDLRARNIDMFEKLSFMAQDNTRREEINYIDRMQDQAFKRLYEQRSLNRGLAALDSQYNVDPFGNPFYDPNYDFRLYNKKVE